MAGKPRRNPVKAYKACGVIRKGAPMTPHDQMSFAIRKLIVDPLADILLNGRYSCGCEVFNRLGTIKCPVHGKHIAAR